VAISDFSLGTFEGASALLVNIAKFLCGPGSEVFERESTWSSGSYSGMFAKS
jgi:hypothetical protein